MAARALHESAAICGGRGKPPVGKRFVKGQSGNPSGLSKEQRAAADAQRAVAQAHGTVLLPDGRTRVSAVLDAICGAALEGSAPHATLYLAYTVGKPAESVTVSGDLRLAIARRVVNADADDSHS